MTSVLMAPEQARKDAQSAVMELRNEVVSFLTDNGGSATLHELVRHLRGRGHADELISRAVAGMLSKDQLLLTAGRTILLP